MAPGMRSPLTLPEGGLACSISTLQRLLANGAACPGHHSQRQRVEGEHFLLTTAPNSLESGNYDPSQQRAKRTALRDPIA